MKSNLLLLLLATQILSCNSKSGNIDDLAKSTIDKNKIEVDSVKAPGNEEIPRIIYDTLVFHENMRGELLNEKFKEGKEKLKYYKAFIAKDKIDTLIIVEGKHSKSELKYLGLLNDLDQKNSYHILTNFTIIGIGEMLSPRGHSEVAFVNKDLDQIIIYNMGMPDNLPLKGDNNQLIFQLEKTEVRISLSGGLPPMLCLPLIGCN